MVAYHNEITDSLEQAIRLKGFGNIEFTAEGNPKTTYNVLHDGCSVCQTFNYLFVSIVLAVLLLFLDTSQQWNCCQAIINLLFLLLFFFHFPCEAKVGYY